MTWNHRIVRRKRGDVEWLAVHEVYYDEHGRADACTTDEVGPTAEIEEGNVEQALKEITEELSRMTRCVEKPILDYDAIGE